MVCGVTMEESKVLLSYKNFLAAASDAFWLEPESKVLACYIVTAVTGNRKVQQLSVFCGRKYFPG